MVVMTMQPSTTQKVYSLHTLQLWECEGVSTQSEAGVHSGSVLFHVNVLQLYVAISFVSAN